MLTQVDLIRGRILRSLQQLSIYISCLPIREQQALENLSGVEGQKTYARITDFVLVQLGHAEPQGAQENSRSYRDSKAFTPSVFPAKNMTATEVIERQSARHIDPPLADIVEAELNAAKAVQKTLTLDKRKQKDVAAQQV